MPKKKRRTPKAKTQRPRPAGSPGQGSRLPAAQENAMRQMEEKVQGRLGDVKLLRNPAGMEKMSTVMERFIEPYMDETFDNEAMNKLLVVAVTAWNAALMEPKERTDFLKKMAKALPWSARRDFRKIVQEMVERKQQFFADNQRQIIDYQITDLGDQYHLSVISSMPPDQTNEKA